MLAFIGGLGWTVSTWSAQLGDVLVLTVLSAILAACFWYCFSRAADWSPAETPSPSLVFDYVLYLGSLTWSVEFAYIENRFHPLSGQWDLYAGCLAVGPMWLAWRKDSADVSTSRRNAVSGRGAPTWLRRRQRTGCRESHIADTPRPDVTASARW